MIAATPVHRPGCVVRLPIKSDSQAWHISHTAASVGHFAPKTIVYGQNKNKQAQQRVTLPRQWAKSPPTPVPSHQSVGSCAEIDRGQIHTQTHTHTHTLSLKICSVLKSCISDRSKKIPYALPFSHSTSVTERHTNRRTDDGRTTTVAKGRTFKLTHETLFTINMVETNKG